MSHYAEAIQSIVDSFERAKESGRRNMNAMSLATVNAKGQPSLRTVLFKSIEQRGVLFFTDQRSRKGQDLEANPIASVCMYWEPIEEQARIDGRIERADYETIEADFAGRPRAGQVLIASSVQSAPMTSMEAFRAHASARDAAYGENVDLPDHWQGYWLVPDYIETWKGSRDRMHERFAYARHGNDWTKEQLQP